jgi:cyclohexanecarboxylate-CoA ligase
MQLRLRHRLNASLIMPHIIRKRTGFDVVVDRAEVLALRDPALIGSDRRPHQRYHHPRRRERACAFVVLRPGQTLDPAGVQAIMAEHRVAKQYWPERVEIVDDLPKTPAGKVRKIPAPRNRRPSQRHPRKANA